MTLRRTERAIDEVAEAVFRYSARSAERAESFLKNYRRALERIWANPRTYTLEETGGDREIRSISLDKFPFSVVYEVLGHEVVMLALWHQHSQGENWSLREA